MTHPESLPPRLARKERLWTWMLVPGTAWMSVFFVSALLLLIALSFGTTDALGNPRFGGTLDNVIGVFTPTYLRVIIRSLMYAVAASVICLVIAYPVAYAIARHGGRYKNALVALLVVPFFANYLVRMYGWQTLLSDESMLMTWLRHLGVSASFHILDTGAAVIGGLVYGYVVFMILPIYASLERMDGALIEAAATSTARRCAPSSPSPFRRRGPVPTPGWRWCSFRRWATSSVLSCSVVRTT